MRRPEGWSVPGILAAAWAAVSWGAAPPASAAPARSAAASQAEAAPPGEAAAGSVALEVGTARAVAGRKVRGALKVLEEADGSPVELPVAIVAGRRPGPVVWVHAGMHGDEYGGPRALQAVVGGLDPEEMAGTLVAVFVANPPAFRGLKRANPSLDDQLDMGDVFPGRPGRFASERIAAALDAVVKERAHYFLDLHTGGDRFRQHPFILYTLTGGVPEERYDDLARGFGIPTLWRDRKVVFEGDALASFSSAGIPSFLIEIGGGQPLDPADLRLQADAVRSFLRKVGVLPGRPPRLRTYTVVSGYLIVTNDHGGFFDAAVGPGDRVREGSILGTITNVYGDVVETLRAPAGSDIVLGVGTYPAAPTGGWILELGTGLQEGP
jgi:predicted deacylase